MSMHIKNRGFTLIELLVVIAIIGILASVVLASLNTARAKGADAAMKSSINNGRAQAELVYDNNGGSYLAPTNVCADPTIVNIGVAVNSAIGAGSFVCSSAANTYRMHSPTKTTPVQYYCVDSTGKAGLQAAAPTGTGC